MTKKTKNKSGGTKMDKIDAQSSGNKIDTACVKEMVTISQIRKGKVIATRHSDKITTTGIAEITKLFGGGGTAFSYLALGTGTTGAAAGDTALEAESSATGLDRASVVPTYTVATASLEHTWTMTAVGTIAITEEGEFNASSGGVMAAHQVFGALNVSTDDEIKVTHKNAFAEG